jgi:hypothetical protein
MTVSRLALTFGMLCSSVGRRVLDVGSRFKRAAPPRLLDQVRAILVRVVM